jgi:hypothetical protein
MLVKTKRLLREIIFKYAKDPHLTLFNFQKYIKDNNELLSSCYTDAKAKNIANLFSQTIQHREGDIAECGVYRAGGTIILSNILKGSNINKHIYGFDSFEGMPKPTNEDKMKNGSISYSEGVLSGTSLKYVEEKAKFFKVNKYITFVKGFFQDTLKTVIKKGQKFCFIIIDPDQYEGTKYCLEFFYDKVVKGGIIVIDDYYLPDEDKLDTPGVKKATDEFLYDKPQKPIHLADSMYYIIK